jgi:hypothetical protein
MITKSTILIAIISAVIGGIVVYVCQKDSTITKKEILIAIVSAAIGATLVYVCQGPKPNPPIPPPPPINGG